MAGYRFGTPYLAPGLFAAAIGANAIADACRDARRPLLLCGLASILALLLFHTVESVRTVRAYARGEVNCAMLGEGFERMGLWVRDNAEPDAVVAAYEVGALGYFGDRRVVDYFGLITPAITKEVKSAGGVSRLRRGNAPQAVQRIAAHVVTERPSLLFVNAGGTFQTGAAVPGQNVRSGNLAFPDQREILEQLEACYGAPFTLGAVFPMGRDQNDRDRLYLALQAPRSAAVQQTACR
jgi:hypothetical protein